MHLGDCMVQTHFMKRLWPMMPEETQMILYCDPAYHDECREFVGRLAKFIFFRAWLDKPETAINSSISGYLQQYILDHGERIGGKEAQIDNRYGTRFFNGLRPYEMNYGLFYVDWFRHLCDEHHLPNPIRESRDLLFDIPYEWSRPVPEKPVRAPDFLIINAPSRMDEYPFNKGDWDQLIAKCKRRGSVVCTHPNSEGAFSTLEHGWSLCDVGRVAMNTKNVIAVHTSPIWAAMNTRSIETVKFWLIFTRGHYFNFNDRFHWSRDWDWGMKILRENSII